jgi:hypothetical protein
MESIVEIDENERYWIGNGFGKGGLLPNDRGAFSTTDGSISWKSAEEASEDSHFLGRGWNYARDEQFAPTRQDHDGWMYAVDFRPNNIADAKPSRGNLHWVRFRRLVRTKTFHPGGFVEKEIYEKCDHCDSKATDTLSNLLLDVIAYISLLNSKAQISDAVLYPLKMAVIDSAIGYGPWKMSESNALQHLDELRKDLMMHIEKERNRHAMSRLLSGNKFLFAEREKHSEFHERCATVAASCLPTNERDAIAGLIVRKLDPYYQLHCDKISCGDDCVFRRVPCPHEGCLESMSKIHLEAHNSVCRYRCIVCDCGETLKAGQMPAHLSEKCRSRIVDCPFKSIGCRKEMRACDLDHHIAEDMAAHLLLAVGQIDAQMKEIVGLHGSLQVLQAENRALTHSVNQQKENFSMKVGDLNAKLKKMDKDLLDVDSAYRKELKLLKSSMQVIS